MTGFCDAVQYIVSLCCDGRASCRALLAPAIHSYSLCDTSDGILGTSWCMVQLVLTVAISVIAQQGG